MKPPHHISLPVLLLLSALIHQPSTGLAQGTAFTYQGRLDDNGSPANGLYDLRLAIHDAPTNGVEVGVFTNAATVVADGLFTVTLDFGSSVFDGSDRWLEIGAVTNGGGAFSTLTPRQQITSTPHAIKAAGLTGTLTANNIVPGSITSQMLADGAVGTEQLEIGAVYQGSFIGDGSEVTNVGLLGINHHGAFQFGDFVPLAILPVGLNPTSVTAADLNGDGQPDLVAANSNADTLTVLTNTGNGNFSVAAMLASSANPNFVLAKDINNDGLADLMAVNTTTPQGGVTVFTNNGGAAFTFSATFAVGNLPLSLAAADVNGDDQCDLISANSGTSTLSVLTNDGAGGFSTSSTPVIGLAPSSVLAVDVNGDGHPDLVSSIRIAETVNILTNDGSGGFTASFTNSVGSFPISLAAADLNKDGWVDVVCANRDSDDVTILTNNGGEGFVLSETAEVGISPHGVAVGDLNADGWVDVVTADRSAPNVLTVLTNDWSGNLSLASSPLAGSSPYAVTVVDVNGDGAQDLIAANFGNATLSVLCNRVIFSGSGAGLTSLSASQLIGVISTSNVGAGAITAVQLADGAVGTDQLAEGSVTSADIADSEIVAVDVNAESFNTTFWRAAGNAGTTPGANFLGTTDSQPLELKVNNQRALRIEISTGAPNLIGGHSGNSIGSGTEGAVIAGGSGNSIGAGTSHSAVGGGHNNIIATNTSAATISGGGLNSIGTNSEYGAIGGGFGNGLDADSRYATITGGFLNDIGGNSYYSAIGGGQNNNIGTNSFNASIAGGGANNIGISSSSSTIGGGVGNLIEDDAPYAVIPGGLLNRVGSATSHAFAAGRRAQANHSGAFVWADSTDADFTSTGTDQFLIRASGGVGVGTGDPDGATLRVQGNSTLGDIWLSPTTAGGNADVFFSETVSGSFGIKLRHNGASNGFEFVGVNSSVETAPLVTIGRGSSSGVTIANNLAVGGNVTANAFVTSSDRNLKENFQPVTPLQVLEKVVGLPISQWNFKTDADATHVGPMAQDFRTAFGLGTDERHIATVDGPGRNPGAEPKVGRQKSVVGGKTGTKGNGDH